MQRKVLFIVAILALSATAIAPVYAAERYREPEVRVFSTDGTEKESFLAYQETFNGGVDVAVAEFASGDRFIVVGAGFGGGPLVRIFREDGTLVGHFWAYAPEVRSGVKVATGDLDGDGVPEIVTGTYNGAGAHVRTFDMHGEPIFTPGFFPYDSRYRGGVNVAVGDVDGDGQDEIITGVGVSASPHVRIFDRYGVVKGPEIYPFSDRETGGVDVATLNVDDGPEDEIVVSVHSAGKPWVKVYRADRANTILGDFFAYPTTYRSGVTVAGGDIDGDGYDEVVVAPTVSGGPHVRGFEAYGESRTVSFMAYEEDFRGGVHVAVGDVDGDGADDVVVGPAKRVAEGRTEYTKYIEVDISDQALTRYENGYAIDSFRVSTGKWDMPTPIGEFSILNKIPRAYSNAYDLYMPWWMAFDLGDGGGSYGLHELPEWADGTKEGESHLGIRVSHGCIRLGVGSAKKVYDWASVGTVVIVQP